MPICIVGMHRSGTSMITRLLRECGLYLGAEEDMLVPNPMNPKGYWENRHFMDFNDELLSLRNATWYDPPPIEPGWSQDHRFDVLRHRAAGLPLDLVAHSLWGWKDPRNALNLEFWSGLFPNAKYLFCLRNPAEVAISLERHSEGFVSYERGLALWQLYHEHILSALPKDRYILTEHSSYFYDAKGELRRVLEFLEIPCDDDKLEGITATVTPELYRNFILPQALAWINVPKHIIQTYVAFTKQAGPILLAAQTDADYQRNLLERSLQETTLKLQAIHKELANNIQNFDAERAAWRDTKHGLQTEIERLYTLHAELYQETKQRLHTLQAELEQDAEQRLHALRAELEQDAEQRLHNLRAELEQEAEQRLNVQAEALQAQHATQHQEMAAQFQAQILDNGQRIESYYGERLAQMETQLAEQQQIADSYRKRLAQKDAQLAEAREREITLNVQAERLTNEKNALLHKIGQMETENQVLQAHNEHLHLVPIPAIGHPDTEQALAKADERLNTALIIVPGSVNYMYDMEGRRIAEALQELGINTTIKTLQAADIQEYGQVFVVNLYEVYFSYCDGQVTLDPENPAIEKMRKINALARFSAVVLLDCVVTSWFRNNMLYWQLSDFDCYIDLGLHDQSASMPPDLERDKYRFLFNGLTKQEQIQVLRLKYQNTERTIPWAFVGHVTEDRAAFVHRLLVAFAPNGFVYAPKLAPISAGGPHIDEGQLQTILEHAEYYVWVSHHEYFYLESQRFRQALLAGTIPLKVMLHSLEDFPDGQGRNDLPFTYLLVNVDHLEEQLQQLDYTSLLQRYIDDALAYPLLENGLMALLSSYL